MRSVRANGFRDLFMLSNTSNVSVASGSDIRADSTGSGPTSTTSTTQPVWIHALTHLPHHKPDEDVMMIIPTPMKVQLAQAFTSTQILQHLQHHQRLNLRL